MNELDQDFGLCSSSLLRWHSLLNWSSQLELWDLMVLGGQKWNERLSVCDPRVCRALLFRCMVTGLCWHFSNFSWLCKVFLQTFLHLASQFCNLKAISKLVGDFATISKLGDHFTEKVACSQTIFEAWSIFAARGGFRRAGEFSQPISQLKSDFEAQR